jgi:23S rRNA (cytosine1962-C5)-methyltransferase
LSKTPTLFLKKDRESPVLRRHPWIFSGAISKEEGDPVSGGLVEIVDKRGNFLAWGAYSPESQIKARIWSWDQEEKIDEEFFRNRLQRSISYRDRIGYDFPLRRLVHGESDGIPGLIVDQYGDYLVIQVLSAGIEYWREEIISQLASLVKPSGIYERSDVEVRSLEGLEKRTGTCFGTVPEDYLEIRQDGLDHWIDIRKGHKTGAYLDQRLNRDWVGRQCVDLSVLDCFCYSGGFSMQALRHGAASTTLVDDSGEALDLARKHLQANGLEQERVEYQQGDVFQILRDFRDRGRKFDVIILDPPKFAPTASHAQRAARGYKDINLLGMKLLTPGGLLATFSCSGGISREFFLRILSGAALDAGVNARIQAHMGQSMDHSVNLSFPEGTYLKGFALRVDKEEV